MPTPSRTPLRAKLRDRNALREAMRFRRINVRELAEIVGSNPATRASRQSMISHLHSGVRDTCDIRVARRIEEALFERPGGLFLPVLTTVSADIRTTPRRKVAA